MNDDIVEETDDFYSLYRILNRKEKDLDRYEYDYKGELKNKRISIKTRLSDNIVNYVAVACGLNYAPGFPTELLRGVSARDIKDVKSAGINSVYDLVCAILLSSEAEGIDETLGAIQKLKAKDESQARGLRILKRTMDNCYQGFYAEYWDRNKANLEARAKRFERITNAFKALDCLEHIAGKKFPSDSLEGFVVDVFRNGGGIYFELPNRIILTSSSSSAFIKHLDIGHEVGHIITRGWQKYDEILDEVNLLAKRMGKVSRRRLVGYIDECLAAFIQLKMDERILKVKRKTHGFMDDAFFRHLDSVWKTSEQLPKRRIENLLLEAIESARKKDVLVKEIAKRFLQPEKLG